MMTEESFLQKFTHPLTPSRQGKIECPPPSRGKVRVGGSRAVLFALALLLLLVAAAPARAVDDGITEYLTIQPGAYIIRTGFASPTVANSLKPYGLVYDLVKNQQVPVLWAINPSKAQDGEDFTDPNSGITYYSGAFIVQMEYLTPTALSTINNWKAQGVIVDGPTTGPIYNVPIYNEIAGLSNVVLDFKSGSINAAFMTTAGIPTTSYVYKDPNALNSCDDVFVMPHADPTWSTHGYLLQYVKSGGYLWSGCHAVSVFENIDDPSTPTINPDMNFLSQTGLVPFGNHADGSPPYTQASSSGGDPVMQFMGVTDGAQQNGSEQIYLPKLGGGWRPGAKVLVYDPTQADVPANSPGLAAAIVYGRAFDTSSYGRVMYEGGHNLLKATAPDNIAAVRAYLNFWLLGLIDQSPSPKGSATTMILHEGDTLTAFDSSYSSSVVYQWSSSGGGTFSAPAAPTTNFTPPEVSADTTIFIKLKVTDPCGRTGFDVIPLLVKNLPKADLAVSKTDSADPVSVDGAFSYTLAVGNLGTEPATNVVVEDVLPAGLIYVSALGTGWTCDYDSETRKVTCTRPDLALTGDTPSNITINVTAPASPTTLTNTATVKSDLPDLHMENNTSTQSTQVLQGIDVAVTKTAPAGPFYSGQNFSYTLNVENISALTATSLTVKDVLPLGPPGLTFVSATGSGWNCVYSSPDRTVTCFNPSLAAAASSTITLTVTPTGATGASIANTATVTSPDFVDQNQDNNSSTATITLSAPADLAITKTGSTTGGKGTQVDTYVVTLTNNGPGTATGIVVNDVMNGPGLSKYASACTVTPSSGTFVFDDGTTWGDVTPNYGTWSLAELSNGDSATLTFSCTGDNNDGVTNLATVTSASYDPDTANNTASAFVMDGTTTDGDIEILKTASPDPVYVGDTITYRITLNNLGTQDANNDHTVVDTLPPGATYAGFANVGGGTWSCPATTPAIIGPATVTCTTKSDLKKSTGSPNTLYFDLLVTAPALAGTITNTVTTSYLWGNKVYDPPANNTASAGTQVIYRSTDIAVTKSVDNATPVLGDNVTFTITATNNGPNPASNLRVTDLLPAGLTYVSSVAAQGSYDPATGLWYVGNLASGVSATLRITAADGAAATNTSCFYAMDQTDTNSDNNCATVAVTPQYADLTISKTVSNATPNVNSNVVFTVTLHNNGPSAVNSVTVTPITVNDIMQPGLEIVSVTPSTGTYDPATGNWTISTLLASGADATLTITAKVTIPAVTLNNTVTIVDSGLPDPTPGNNSASVTLVGQQADIEVSKVVDITVPLDLNTNLTFTITAKSNGPSDATGLQVTDILSAGLEYVSDTPSQGTYTPETGIWDIGSLANGASVTLALVAKNTAYGNLTNTAAKSSLDQYDPITNGDTDSVTIQSGGSADLELAKSVDKPATYQGDTVTFTVRLRNQGPNPATGVVVSDQMPAGLTYVSSFASQGSYDSGTGDWTVGDVAFEQVVTLQITATATASGLFTNTATIKTPTNQADPDTSNNTGSTLIDIKPAADLAITKSGPTSLQLAGAVTYILKATNNGPTDVTEASITDTVPAQITAVSWSCVATGEADCDTTAGGTGAAGSGNAITLNHVQIKAGAGNYLTITVNGTAGATGTFTNTVIFSPPGTIFDPNVANNSASVTTVVSSVLLTGRVFADIGTGGGIANDGVLNGGEAGIAKVTVTLTDCSSTTYVTTTTDGSGDYALAIPNTVSPGTTLCVMETNLSGYISTGGQVGNTEGVYDRTTDRVQFVLAANTNYTNVNFGDVPMNRFLTDGAKTALPGSTVSYPHIFISGTGGEVTFTTFAAASPPIAGWSEELYLDAGCTGSLNDPPGSPVTGAITVTAGEPVCLIVQEFVPAQAPPGASNLVTIQANFNYTNANPALTGSYTHQDLTIVSDVSLLLTKAVRNVTRSEPWATMNTAKQGEVLEYRITYLNNGVHSINNLVVNDSTPAFTTLYESALCGSPLPSSLSSCEVSASPPVGSPGAIKWTFTGSLDGSAPGTVTYQVKVE